MPDAGEGSAGGDERLYEEIEGAILGSPRSLTRRQVAARAEVPLERAIALWRALGFSGVEDDEAIFVEADVDALRLVSSLVDSGIIDPRLELTLVRSMGRSFARLAEWEVAELGSRAFPAASADEGAAAGGPDFEALVHQLIPVVQDVQNYVWRRHLASATGRLLLRPQAEEGTTLTVGFADIVGFTRRSRDLSRAQLGDLIETFEGRSASVIHEHNGRIIKTIGDEILFVTDDPVDAANLALRLTEETDTEAEGFPELRVGLAHGSVLTKLGDVFGPVVNIASRLTSLARPGRVLVDRDLAELLKADPDSFRVRRARTATVRGYARLETWSLKRSRDARPG